MRKTHFFALVLLPVLRIEALVGQESGTLDLEPIADTSIFEEVPESNFGGFDSIPAGASAKGRVARALFRFDFSGISAGSVLTEFRFQIPVLRAPLGGGADSDFELRRLLVPWNEGEGAAILGAQTTESDASWVDRGSDGPWSAPGGVPGIDFAEIVSGTSSLIDGPAIQYSLTEQIARDIEFWREFPERNFGWIVLAVDEEARGSARRLASRENEEASPRLTLSYGPSALEIVAPRLSIARNETGDGFDLLVESSPDTRVSILRSMDLRNWDSIDEVTTSPAGFGVLSFGGEAAIYFKAVAVERTE